MHHVQARRCRYPARPPFAWCDCSHPIMYDDGKFTRLEGSFPQAISHDDVYHHIKLEICERGGSPADLPLDAVAAVGGGGSLCAPRLPPQVSTGRVAAGFSAAACCGSCHSCVRRPAHVLTPGMSFSPTPSLCPHSGVTCALSFAHKTHFIATFDIREEVNRNMPLRSRIQTPVLRYCQLGRTGALSSEFLGNLPNGKAPSRMADVRGPDASACHAGQVVARQDCWADSASPPSARCRLIRLAALSGAQVTRWGPLLVPTPDHTLHHCCGCAGLSVCWHRKIDKSHP